MNLNVIQELGLRSSVICTLTFHASEPSFRQKLFDPKRNYLDLGHIRNAKEALNLLPREITDATRPDFDISFIPSINFLPLKASNATGIVASEAKTTEEIFFKGTMVEASSNGDGFRCAWFAVSIVEAVETGHKVLSKENWDANTGKVRNKSSKNIMVSQVLVDKKFTPQLLDTLLHRAVFEWSGIMGTVMQRISLRNTFGPSLSTICLLDLIIGIMPPHWPFDRGRERNHVGMHIDGRVLSGRSVVDESMITGESLPVYNEKSFTSCDEVPLSVFCLTNVGEWDKFRNIDRNILVLWVQDLFHRLLLHGVCEFYNLVSVDTNLAPQQLEFLPLNVVFKPFDRGREHGSNIRGLYDVGNGTLTGTNCLRRKGMHIVEGGDNSIVTTEIKAKVLQIKDKKGQTALHMAVTGQYPSVVEELLLADCSVLNEHDKERVKPDVCIGSTVATEFKAKVLHQIIGGLHLLATSCENSEALALISDGKSLTCALEIGVQHMILELALGCASVIYCRFSPKQKALVTRLVKIRTGSTTLAIGDGANDVGMLQEADTTARFEKDGKDEFAKDVFDQMSSPHVGSFKANCMGLAIHGVEDGNFDWIIDDKLEVHNFQLQSKRGSQTAPCGQGALKGNGLLHVCLQEPAQLTKTIGPMGHFIACLYKSFSIVYLLLFSWTVNCRW